MAAPDSSAAASPSAETAGKRASWLSRSKSGAKASLQRLGQRDPPASHSSSSSGSSSVGPAGVVGAALTRIVSSTKRTPGDKDGKGKEREAAVVEQDEGGVVDDKVRKAVGGAPPSPRIILGAVEDNWQMYRCALSLPLATSHIVSQLGLCPVTVAGQRTMRLGSLSVSSNDPTGPGLIGARANAPRAQGSARPPSSTLRPTRPSWARARLHHDQNLYLAPSRLSTWTD